MTLRRLFLLQAVAVGLPLVFAWLSSVRTAEQYGVLNRTTLSVYAADVDAAVSMETSLREWERAMLLYALTGSSHYKELALQRGAQFDSSYDAISKRAEGGDGMEVVLEIRRQHDRLEASWRSWLEDQPLPVPPVALSNFIAGGGSPELLEDSVEEFLNKSEGRLAAVQEALAREAASAFGLQALLIFSAIATVLGAAWFLSRWLGRPIEELTAAFGNEGSDLASVKIGGTV